MKILYRFGNPVRKFRATVSAHSVFIENAKLQGLKEQKDAAVSGAIQGGTETLLNGGIQMITINKAINTNRGMRTGA